MTSKGESRLARWSRRKMESANEPSTPQEQQATRPESDFDDVDFSALDINSDFTRFMAENVPDTIRNRALRMLWSSSDVIGKPDDLDDFLEDFTEQAKAVSPEFASSAYKIGAGFVLQHATLADAGAKVKADQDDSSNVTEDGLSHQREPEPEVAGSSHPRSTRMGEV